MSQFKYILEKYNGMNTRYKCPQCDKGKTLSLYLDTETKEHLAHHVGRCSREVNCGYHYTPKKYFEENQHLKGVQSFSTHTRARAREIVKPTTFIQPELVEGSLRGYDKNNFVAFLKQLFPDEVCASLIERYKIGTSKHWEGASIFWQKDLTGKVRTGKIMLYSPVTGKRVKEPYNHITWAHKALKLPEFELKQCLFGEHLLTDQNKTVAIVESEKTAILASGVLPEFIWLAAGSLQGLNETKFKVLNGRNVIFYPDLNGFDKWSEKATQLKGIAKIKVSNILELKATEDEKKQGLDLADYLINLKSDTIKRDGDSTKSDAIKNLEEVQSFAPNTRTREGLQNNSDFLKVQSVKLSVIEELELFFNSVTLPEQIQLNRESRITNLRKFIDSHLTVVKAQGDAFTFIPYTKRLTQVKEILSSCR